MPIFGHICASRSKESVPAKHPYRGWRRKKWGSKGCQGRGLPLHQRPVWCLLSHHHLLFASVFNCPCLGKLTHQKNANNTSNEKLQDNDRAKKVTNFLGISVHARHDVRHSFHNCDKKPSHCDGENLMGSVQNVGCIHFWAPLNSALSSFTLSSTAMIFAPDKSCMTNPAVTIGEMPSSINVPLLEANITRIQ